jgi:hypothetical protein
VLDWQSNLIMYRVRRVIDLTWLRVLSRETDTELRPAKASDITWFRASKSCSSLSGFFPLHPLAISNRQHRDSRLTLLLHRIMLPSNRFILCWVLRSLDTESFSPSYGSVPIILHHKLDSGQRRDPTVADCSQQRVIRTYWMSSYSSLRIWLPTLDRLIQVHPSWFIPASGSSISRFTESSSPSYSPVPQLLSILQPSLHCQHGDPGSIPICISIRALSCLVVLCLRTVVRKFD